MSRSRLYIGGCNQPVEYFASSHSPGITLHAFDADDGEAPVLARLETIDNPTFLVADASGRRIYATSEMPERAEGAVTAIELEVGDTRLTPLGVRSSAGSITAHVSLDRTGRFLLVANHGADVELGGRDQALAVIALEEATGLAELVAHAAHTGSGPRLPRQGRSHPHAVLATPDNRHLIVTDLGTDSLEVYRFDASDGRVAHAHSISLEPGSRPRHFAFSPDGQRVHVDGELDSSVTTLALDASSGALRTLGRCRTVPADFDGQNLPSDIVLAPSGRHAYVANRGHDSIARIALGEGDAAPTLVDTIACGGRTPRHMAVDPGGTVLAVANQDSDRVSLFRIGARERLEPMAASIVVGTPTCLVFVPADGHG